MELHSTSLDGGGQITQQHGKRVDNVSPQLSWSGAPSKTGSFVLTMVDRHPIADGYVHWVVTGIPSDVDELPENAARVGLPDGASESRPYVGPFPPSGTHEYEFTLYAVDSSADVPARATLERVLHALEPHLLARATLTGSFTQQPK